MAPSVLLLCDNEWRIAPPPQSFYPTLSRAYRTVHEAEAACCASAECAGFSIDLGGDGCFKPNSLGPFTPSNSYSGYDKPGFTPPTSPMDITITFADVGLLTPTVNVYDIWAQKNVGAFSGSYTAKAVPFRGTAFLRLSSA